MGKRKRDEDEYQVEVILGSRVNDECEWEYLIRWAGYEEEEDTWESTENIQTNCQRLISSFWNNVGTDDEDYHPGAIFTPSDEWIEMERKKYYRDNKQIPKTKKSRHSRSVKRVGSEGASSVASSSKVKNLRVKGEPSEDDALLRAVKRRQVVVDSDSSDDVPLARSTKKSSSVATVKKTKTTSESQGSGKNKKEEQEAPSSPSPLGSLFSGPEEPSSSPSHDVSAFSPQLQPSGSGSKRPTALKVRIPSQYEPFIPSASAKPPTSTRSASNTPNIPVKIPNFLRVPESSTTNESATPSGSNLSVKSRLYKTAMVPTNPKNASSETSRVMLPPATGIAARKTSLNTLYFKKKPAPVQVSPTITSDDLRPRIPSYSSPDPSPVIPSYVPTFATAPTSPVSASRIPRSDPMMAGLNAAPSPIEHMANLSINSPSGSSIGNDIMPPVNPMDQPSFLTSEVDSFLHSIMPVEMAAPFEIAPIETNDDAIHLPIRTSLSTSDKPTVTGKIQKIWKWTGEIQIKAQSEIEAEVKEEEDGHSLRQSPRHEVQVLCRASMIDTVQLAKGGMPFRVVLPEGVKSLFFQTFLPVDHLEDVLPACKPEAIGRLIPTKDEEGGRGEEYERLGRFADYLRFNNQVAISPVYMDEIHTANILCLSPTFLNRIERHVRVPAELTTAADSSSGLVAVLLSWGLSRKQLNKNDWRAPNNQLPQCRDLISDERLLRNPEFKCTVGILGYPQWLHEWFKEWQRSFSIWSGGSVNNNNRQSGSVESNTSATAELEINLLKSLLTKCKLAESESEDASVARVIFIHAQELGMISKLPHLRRRRETIETMFVVFGTSSPSCGVSLSQGEWPSCGFWEVYPIGGVVTFTAKALFRHTDVILDRTQEIAEYPLWTSYIIPTVFGMAVTLYYRDINDDPMEAFDRGDFAYQFLLDAIHEGEVGLLRCPPPISNVTTTHWTATDEHGDHPSTVFDRHHEKDDDRDNWRDPRSAWFSEQIDSIFREPKETLEFCLKEFKRVYGAVPPNQWDSLLGEEIADDVKRMQVQPAIAREYRRYVVLKAEEEKGYHDELEWISPEMFEVYNESGTPPPDSPSVMRL